MLGKNGVDYQIMCRLPYRGLRCIRTAMWLIRKVLRIPAGETNVVLCRWRKTPDGWRLWKKGCPDVFGEGMWFEEAQERLIDAVMGAAHDLDSVVPAVPEYDPPLPVPAEAKKYLDPELYLISGDEVFELGDEMPVPLPVLDDGTMRSTRFEIDREAIAARKDRKRKCAERLFNQGLCLTCGAGLGGRSKQQVTICSAGHFADAGWVRGMLSNHIRVFSDRFVALITDDEKKRFVFRPVRLLGKSRNRYLELSGEPVARFVGVKGLDVDGMDCSSCGSRRLNVNEPWLQREGLYLRYFVSRADLPNPMPTCFPVSDGRDLYICMSRQRWDDIRGHRHARGVMAQRLGVVDETECDHRPRLRNRDGRCQNCACWPEPTTLSNKTRRVWSIPACDGSEKGYAMRNLDWLMPAAEEGVIRIVRETIAIPALKDLIASGERPSQIHVISFRCPDCWRLGQVIMDCQELQLRW